MHIDRMVRGVLLAGGLVLGCGGNQAQSAGPVVADPVSSSPMPGSAPVASASTATGEAPVETAGSDPKAICERAAKAEASGIGTVDDGMAAAELGPLPKHVFVATTSDRNAKEGSAKEYSMADLKALSGKGQWEELIQHIEDVPPSKRNAEWDALLERAATELLTQHSNSSGYAAFRSAELLVERYPTLTKSERFMAKRYEVSTLAFQNCLAESYDASECLRAMQDFLKVGSPPSDVAFQFGKLVRAKLNHHLAVPFFHRGLQGKPANSPECADQDLGLAVKSGLALPPAEESARLARDIAGERCFGVLESVIVAQLTASGSDSFDAKNICDVLKAKGAL